MDGPESKIALSAVARNSWPIALILLWDPRKIIFSGGWSYSILSCFTFVMLFKIFHKTMLQE